MNFEALTQSLSQRGYMPGKKDALKFLAALEEASREQTLLLERALARYPEIAELALARFEKVGAVARARLTRLIGAVAADDKENETLREFLFARLFDPEGQTRRYAVNALGKIATDEDEAKILAAAEKEKQLETLRAFAFALGKVGGKASLQWLKKLSRTDAELKRLADEATIRIERTVGRVAPGKIRLDQAARVPLQAVLECREGLEEIVVAQAAPTWRGARAIGPGRVGGEFRGTLSSLVAIRSALRVVFPLPYSDAKVSDLPPIGAAVVNALTSEVAKEILEAFTIGPERYRIEWASAGHRRGLTYRVAEEARSRNAKLVNDPTQSLWELVVDESGEQPRISLWPRGVDDERFSYRVEQVPASSHPTIAAALATLAGVRDDDVVWDPFVGSGTELVERARLGKYRRLIGTDMFDKALFSAHENFKAVGLEGVILERDDACAYQPAESPTLIITNPPMGRRVGNKTQTGPLLASFLRNAWRVLAPGGRLVWISPRARDTAELAVELGFEVVKQQRIDMSGFWAEIQMLVKPDAKAVRSKRPEAPTVQLRGAVPPRSARSPGRGPTGGRGRS